MRSIMRSKVSAMPLAIGFAIGLVVAPVSAVAAVAAGKVMITDGHDTAAVTQAGQVQVATTDVKNAKFRYTAGVTSSTCSKIYTAPARKGFIFTQVRFDVWQDPSPGSGEYVAVFSNATCTFGKTVLLDNPGGVGLDTLELNPGLPLAGGKSLYAMAGGSVGADVMVSGYLVAANAVPRTVPSTFGFGRHAAQTVGGGH